MVADLVRDSIFGQLVRLITRNKVFQYPEERDPSLWQKYVNAEKSGNMASYGQPEPPQDDEKEEDNESQTRRQSSRSSSSTQVGENECVNEASGKTIDPEKGQDSYVVDWYGPDDEEVMRYGMRTSIN